MPITIACTGHRPQKIPQMQSAAYYEVYHKLEQVAQAWLLANRPAALISGLALGWDTVCAEVAVRLDIPLICAIPHPTQADRWRGADKQTWTNLQGEAKEVHIISPHFTQDCLQLRNKWMVDRADAVLALWSGVSGGTKNCITYAVWREKPYTNLWPKFINWRQPTCP